MSQIAGYEVKGKKHVACHNSNGEETVFIQRWAAKSNVWLRFVKKISEDGYWVSGYPTLKEAKK